MVKVVSWGVSNSTVMSATGEVAPLTAAQSKYAMIGIIWFVFIRAVECAIAPGEGKKQGTTVVLVKC